MHEMDPISHKARGTTGQKITGLIREFVFGAEDGLLSTLGLVTGVAAGTTSTSVILLAGVVGALTGAISMGAGNYLGIKSEIEVLERRLKEEEKEIREHPEHESEELARYYGDRGMNPEDVQTTVQAILRNKTFLLEEMAAHELHINPEDLKSPISKAFWMFLSFLVAAVFPIWPYAVFGHQTAFVVSVCTAIVAIFAIGAGKTYFTGLNPIKSGLAMLAVAASAGIVGYVAGHFLGISGI